MEQCKYRNLELDPELRVISANFLSRNMKNIAANGESFQHSKKVHLKIDGCKTIII